ncbi:hypothetical protein [Acidiluteibacter ferrifornacis]|uniref:Uncharacterized protein n=1 Tax=Acidiluteibacter ferrifornacis TaxID=2692424 RepID=A0A6N9NI29_9FLAO|nr:hypothetical protein [Acidiluteibacter ferrifornacis]NBG65553.1 hypothetical protein [Acidiluteibacter ferrifornacis]
MNLAFKEIAFIILLVFTLQSGFGQSVLIDKDGGNPHESSIMELRSTDKGFLAPRMLDSERLSIPSPATGLMVFQTNGTKGFYFFNGASWDTLGGTSNITYISNVINSSTSGITLISDQKPVNTNGGKFFSGSWQKRDLNTISGDLSNVNLLNDTISIDSGVYLITISAPAFEVDEHQVRLFNVTKNAVTGAGTMSYSNKFASTSSQMSIIVEIGTSEELFIVQHRCTITSANNNGFGKGSSWSENVYTQVQIQKL